MAGRLSKEDFQGILDLREITVKLMGEYKNARTKSWFLFECGHGVYVNPNQVRNGVGCGICQEETRPTSEKINQELKESGRTVRIAEEYVNANTKVLFKDECGHSWKAIPNDVLRGSGCFECYGSHPMTKEEINKKLSDQGRSVRLIGNYSSNKEKTLWTDACGHFWDSTAINVLHNGHGCRQCFGNVVLSKKEINRRLSLEGRDVELIGDYTSLKIPSLWTSSCGHEWISTPDNVINSSTSCTKCNNNGTDNNLAYAYEVVGEFVDGVQVYKFGISSIRRGDQRIKDVCRKHGFEYKILRLVATEGKATDIENILKKIGPQLEGYSGDGATELRAWTDTQLAEALAVIDAGAADEILAA